MTTTLLTGKYLVERALTAANGDPLTALDAAATVVKLKNPRLFRRSTG